MALPELENALCGIATDAGNLLVENLNRPGVSTILKRKRNGDYSIRMDAMAENFILESMSSAGLEGRVMAEETGRRRLGAGHEYCYYIDAIDGSFNFSKGIPFFCVSIALAMRGQVIFGVVCDPCHRESFTAERGKGARINGSPVKRLESSDGIKIIAVDHIERIPWVVTIAGDKSMGIQMNWAVALNVCYVACGRYAGAISPDVRVWDVAAAALVARETTANVTNFANQQWRERDRQIVTSADEGVHRRLVQMANSVYCGNRALRVQK